MHGPQGQRELTTRSASAFAVCLLFHLPAIPRSGVRAEALVIGAATY